MQVSNPSIVLTPSLFALIDEAGSIHAEVARLTKQLDSLKATIKAEGLGKHAGFIFEANVYEKAGSEKVNWEAVAKKLNPSYQLIAAHTTVSDSQVAINFKKV
jgi:hypothetical protein